MTLHGINHINSLILMKSVIVKALSHVLLYKDKNLNMG